MSDRHITTHLKDNPRASRVLGEHDGNPRCVVLPVIYPEIDFLGLGRSCVTRTISRLARERSIMRVCNVRCPRLCPRYLHRRQRAAATRLGPSLALYGRSAIRGKRCLLAPRRFVVAVTGHGGAHLGLHANKPSRCCMSESGSVHEIRMV